MLAGVFAAGALFNLSAQEQTPDEGAQEAALVYPYIFIANADGSGAWPLTRGRGPSWSSDGQQIAFYREGGFLEGEVFYMRVDQTWGAPIRPGT